MILRVVIIRYSHINYMNIIYVYSKLGLYHKYLGDKIHLTYKKG